MELIRNGLMVCIVAGLIVWGCANEEGDEVECPVCDEATEALVGTQCVPLEEVEVCGPDGHLHGPVCHCFGDQEVTEINGVRYCLQAECGVVSAKVEADESPAEDHSDHGDEHADHGDEHADHGDEHADHGDEHADEGDDHADEGDDHADEGDDHADEGDDHADEGDDHGHADEGDDHADEGDEM